MGEKETAASPGSAAASRTGEDDWTAPVGVAQAGVAGAAGGGGMPESAEGIIRSKSNITNNRGDEEAARLNALPPGVPVTGTLAGAGGGGGDEAARLNALPPGEPTTSTMTEAGGVGLEPSEAINLNSSKSN
jgi:hypothetical protein